jgi:hypothetical protein
MVGRSADMTTKQCEIHKVNYNYSYYKKCPWCKQERRSTNRLWIIVIGLLLTLIVVWAKVKGWAI